jgi:hypothetical protein
MYEVKTIYIHHTNEVIEVKPFYEWTVFMQDSSGRTDKINVWAQDEQSAEEDAIYSSSLFKPTIIGTVRTDDIKYQSSKRHLEQA